MDHAKMKAAIDIDTANKFRPRSALELNGMVQFLRQQIVDAEWEIARAKSSISAYQAVIDAIEISQRDPTRCADQ
jgi:hypothetical protein